jgi:hypothetical protein
MAKEKQTFVEKSAVLAEDYRPLEAYKEDGTGQILSSTRFEN